MSGLSLIDVWYRRLPRYLFIEDRLREQAVLELGCGSGLGADFLVEQGATRVVGVDADERQILKARARYKRPNLSFEVSTGPELPFADGEFGVVLIPEGSRAIEDTALLVAARRVLAPGGLCLLAAPNGDLEEPDPDGLSYYDMIESLEPVFPSVTMVAQTPMLAFTFVDFLASAEDLDVGLDDSLAQDLVDDVAYYVALCAQEPYSPQVFSITQVPFAPVARRVQHLLDGQPPEQLELGQLQEALAAERDERIRQADATGELERDLLESQNITRELRARLASADEQQAEAEARLTPLQAELDQASAVAETLRQTADGLERERNGLQDQATRYAQRAEAAEADLEAAREEAGALQQRAQSQSAALSELDELRTRVAEGEQEQAAAAEQLAREQAAAAEQLAREQAAAAERLAQQQERVETRLAERNKALTALEATQKELATAQGELEAARQAEQQQQERMEALAAELDGAHEEADRVRQSLEKQETRVAELEQELGAVREGAEQGGHRIVALERELGEQRDQAEERAHRLTELERELGEVRGAADQQRQRADELERFLNEAHEAVDQRGERTDELERELEAIRMDAEGRGRRAGELEQELGEVRAEAERRSGRLAELEEGLEAAREEIAQRKQRTGELKREVELVESRAVGLGRRVGELEQALDTLRAEAENAREESLLRIEQLREQVAEAEVALEAAQQQGAGLAERLDAQQARAAELESSLSEARAEAEQTQEQTASTEQQLEAMEAGLDASRGEVKELTAELEQAQRSETEQGEALLDARRELSGLAEELAQAARAQENLERVQQQLLAADEQRAARDGQARTLQRELATSQADRRSLEVRLEQALIRADQSEVTGQEDRQRQEDLETRLIGDLEEARAEHAQTRLELEQQRTELAQRSAELERTSDSLAASQAALEQRGVEQEEGRAELERMGGELAASQAALEQRGVEQEEGRAELERMGGVLAASQAALDQGRAELTQARQEVADTAGKLSAVQSELAAVQDQAQDQQASGAEQLWRLREARERAAALEAQAQGLAQRLAEQENQTYGAEDRLRAAVDGLAAREAALAAVQTRLGAEQADGVFGRQQLASARQSLEELEGALEREQRIREDIEGSLEAVESSMRELSSAGERAVQELEAARQEASEQAAEVTRWQQRHGETQQALQQARDQAAALEAARESADRDETVRQLRSELASVRAQGAALGAERARLLREASLAEDARESVAHRLSSAERAHEQTARGMELVIARLESERERAEALDREVRDLRARIEERGEFTVNVTREAAAEAQRARRYRREFTEAQAQAESLRVELDRRTAELQEAREGLEASAAPASATHGEDVGLAPIVRRLEERTTELQAAQVRIRELSDRVGDLSAERQELRRAHAAAVQAGQGQGVSDWDAEIQAGRLSTLEAERSELEAALQERGQVQRELETRFERQAGHVRELLAGAERHRIEMADREIALAEQVAFNAELRAARDQATQALETAREAQQGCQTRLTEAQTEAQSLGVELARLEGNLQRRVAELEDLRTTAEGATDMAETERAMEAALAEAAAFGRRLEDSKLTLFEQKDRIEELEALLELAKHTKSRNQESAKKRETLIGIGPETERITKPAPPVPSVDLDRLRSALGGVVQLEKTCQMEEERVGMLATSLTRLSAQAVSLQEQLQSERLKLAEVEQQRREMANQASRVPELELELELIRGSGGGSRGADQTERAELAERLLKEQKILTEEAIGDKDAEILLLHASMESLQRRARELAGNIQEALRGGGPPESRSVQVLLDRVKAELEGIGR